MTYSSAHLQFTFHGGLPGNEVWSVGLRVLGAGAVTSAQLATLTQQACDRFRTFAAAEQTAIRWAIQQSYAGCTGRVLSTLGVTTDLIEKPPTTALPAGSGNQTLPQQVAVCVTLASAVLTRRGRGRIYLPLLCATLNNSTGRLSAPSAVATNVKTMIDGMHTDWRTTMGGTISPRVQVMSRVGAGAANAVTSIRVGDEFDTQRRRRSSIIELYSTAALA